MSTAVSVRLSEAATETLDNITNQSGRRRGQVISHALYVLEQLLSDPTHVDPMIQFLRREYKYNGA